MMSGLKIWIILGTLRQGRGLADVTIDTCCLFKRDLGQADS